MKKQAAGSEKAFFSKSGTSCNIQAKEAKGRRWHEIGEHGISLHGDWKRL